MTKDTILRAVIAAALAIAITAGLTACTRAEDIKDPEQNTRTQAGENNAQKDAELEEFYEHEFDRPDPLEGKELTDYTAMELTDTLISGEDGETAALLMAKLLSEPVETLDCMAYADSQGGQFPYEYLFTALEGDKCAEVDAALESAYDHYRAYCVSQPGFDGGTMRYWDTSVDMRAEAAAYFKALGDVLAAYRGSDAFKGTGHICYIPGQDGLEFYISVDDGGVALDKTGQSFADGTATGIFYIASGTGRRYELYKLKGGAVAAADLPSSDSALLSDSSGTLDKWLSAACEKLGLDGFTTAEDISSLREIVVIYEDGDVADITEEDRLSAFEALVGKAEQKPLPDEFTYAFTLQITRGDGEVLNVRTALEQPGCIITDSGVCYDLGQSVFDFFGMGDLLS